MKLLSLLAVAGAAALFLHAGSSPVLAADANGFFKGKTLTFNIGYGPGGGYDTYSRLIAAHIGNHIPGNPNVVPKNVPGAGSMKLGNALYAGMPKDGTAIGMIGDSLHISELLGDKNVRFKAVKFNWIGRLADTDPVMVLRPDKGIRTLADIQQKEAAIGIPGTGSSTGMIVSAINYVTGARFKLISGYKGSSEIRLAVERGELDGAQSVIWSLHKPWIDQNNLVVFYQVTQEKLPGLEDVPLVTDLAEDEAGKKLLRFFSSYTAIGRSAVAPPDVPQDRVAVLRAASCPDRGSGQTQDASQPSVRREAAASRGGGLRSFGRIEGSRKGGSRGKVIV